MKVEAPFIHLIKLHTKYYRKRQILRLPLNLTPLL